MYLILLRCGWAGTPDIFKDVDIALCPSNLFTEMMTEFGMCHSFNKEYPENLMQTRPGVSSGFNVWVNVRQEEYSGFIFIFSLCQ